MSDDSLENSPNTFLSSTKSRLLVILGVVVLVVLGVFTWMHFRSTSVQGSSQLTGAPNIQSIPGSDQSSDAYVADQQKQNQTTVQNALKNNTSAVPTITRSGFKGSVEAFSPNATGAQCPVIAGVKKDPQNCTVDRLQAAREAGVTVSELRCQGCECPSLRLAGYNAGHLKQAGYSAKALKTCGYSIKDLVAAGFSAKELQDAGFTPSALQAAGVSVASESSNQCDVETLKRLKSQGMSASDLKGRGCSAKALLAAGFTPSELKAAGLSAGELVANGASPSDLLDAGFGPKSLNAAGSSARELKNAGVSASSLTQAGYTHGDLLRAGFAKQDMSNANPCSQASLKQSIKQGVSAQSLISKGCSRASLLQAGYTLGSLPPEDLLASSVNQLQSGDSNGGSSVPAIDDQQNIAKRIAAMQRQQEARMTEQQRQERARALVSQMQAQAGKLIDGWSNVSKMSYNVVQGVDRSNGVSSSSTNGDANKVEGPVITAGTVMFAVLQTGVNTDENSPILAKIVAGPLKGARLVGQFSRLNKKVLLNFKSFSIRGYGKSIPFTAVAIDQNTAHTAVSGHVNSHYLLRYGSLFASAFMSGYADALVAGGTTVQGLGGFLVQTNNELTPQQQLLVGLGNVGKQYSSKMSGNINRPPTVKIPAGTGIGVLLTSDLQLPIELTNQYNAFKKMEKYNDE